MAKYDKADIERRMQGAIESLKGDLSGLRTGRANTSLLDPVMVESLLDPAPQFAHQGRTAGSARKGRRRL